jgi:hypothetical protein
MYVNMRQENVVVFSFSLFISFEFIRMFSRSLKCTILLYYLIDQEL